MKKVAIAADSVACLPKELVDRYDIHIIPINIIIGDKSYRDGIDISTTDFYNNLNSWKKLPTTAAPSPGDFLEFFRTISKQADSILLITVSSKLSAVYQSACNGMDLANNEIPQARIILLDSQTAAGAEGFVTLAAARAADSGATIEEAILAAENMRSKVYMFSMLDTLHYLAKGGRIPKAAAWAGSLFKIKPILHIAPASGEVQMADRQRTRRKGIERLIELMRERVGDQQLHINIQHTNVIDEAEKLRERILDEFNCVESYITDFTPVMGAHTGPGLLALNFYCGE